MDSLGDRVVPLVMFPRASVRFPRAAVQLACSRPLPRRFLFSMSPPRLVTSYHFNSKWIYFNTYFLWETRNSLVCLIHLKFIMEARNTQIEAEQWIVYPSPASVITNSWSVFSSVASPTLFYIIFENNLGHFAVPLERNQRLREEFLGGFQSLLLGRLLGRCREGSDPWRLGGLAGLPQIQ